MNELAVVVPEVTVAPTHLHEPFIDWHALNRALRTNPDAYLDHMLNPVDQRPRAGLRTQVIPTPTGVKYVVAIITSRFPEEVWGLRSDLLERVKLMLAAAKDRDKPIYVFPHGMSPFEADFSKPENKPAIECMRQGQIAFNWYGNIDDLEKQISKPSGLYLK